MKSQLSRSLIIGALIVSALAPSTFAQRQLGKKKGPTSKIFLAETKGETQILNDDKVYTARQATAFDAPGSVIETKADSHNAFVYSNGTGMFVDQNTRVEIDRFVQEPFQPVRNQATDTPVEPSISQSNIFVARGAVAVCTSQLVSGSTMNYGTPEAGVNIRNGKVSIQSEGNVTTVDLLDGDITVRGGGRDVGGQLMRPGERATITLGRPGQPPTISIAPIPQNVMQTLDDRVSMACNARKTVTFEAIEQKATIGLDAPEVAPGAAPTPTPNNPSGNTADGSPSTNPDNAAGSGDDTEQVIVAKPTVPATLPINATVSAARIEQ
jgi:hypothetical protein